jgi:DHA1 family tetracycline resistance protein-like MFS transporter
MVAVAFLLSLASQGANTVAVVYAIHRYDWSPAAIGVLLTVFAIASLAAQAGLVSRVERQFGPRGAMVGSLALTAVGLFIFGLAPTGLVFALAVPFLAIGALSGAIMAGYFTGQVGDAEQGRLQGAWGSINSLMGLAAPPLFTWVFSIGASATWIGLSGAPFVLAAALVAASLLIAGRAPWPRS